MEKEASDKELSLSRLSQYWWFKAVLAILALAGIFQLGYILGNLAFGGADWLSISVLQAAILGSGVWAFYEIIAIIRKPKIQ